MRPLWVVSGVAMLDAVAAIALSSHLIGTAVVDLPGAYIDAVH